MRRLIDDQRGSVLPVMAALLLACTVGGALAVDLTRAYTLREQLQTAADSAALAAATVLPDTDKAKEIALSYVAKNMPSHGEVLKAEDITFGTWDAAGRHMATSNGTASAVQVVARLAEANGNAISTIFAGLIGADSMDISAKATAGKGTASCVLALDPSSAGALSLDGKSSLEAYQCGVQVNSRSTSALSIAGGGTLLSGSTCVSGGASIAGNGVVNPDPVTFCPPSTDPLADLDVPEGAKRKFCVWRS